MNQRRSLAVVDTATPAQASDQPPAMSEGDALDFDIAGVLRAHADLVKAIYDVDIEELRGAIVLAECFVVGPEGEDERARLERVLASARRQATRKQIAQQLAMLFAGFPAAAKLEGVYTRLVAEDVGWAEPSLGALAAAVRKLRRTWRPEFGRQVPAIAEILAALEPEEKRLATAAYAVDDMPVKITAAKKRLAELIADRKAYEDEARAQIRRRIEAGKDTDGWELNYPGLADKVRAELAAEAAR